MIVYLAGPDVFLPDALVIGQRKVALCAQHRLAGLYPLDNAVDLASPNASRIIFDGNEAKMERADAIVANLTPFRGPGADAGTVYELGFMAGRGKRCFAYCNDARLYKNRIPDRNGVVDADGLTVEDFGHADNLMMIHALERYGAPLLTPRETPADPWHDLTLFEQCLKLIAQRA
jgi:nucleoside 2-deoxyribosyltransferase